jgi:subtilase family serine protease
MRKQPQPRPLFESLESRLCLSAGPTGMSPAQIRHAYGFDQITFQVNGKKVPANGAGQTIAIVDAYDDPNIAKDLAVFDKMFHLPTVDGYGRPLLSVVKPKGTPVSGGWALEESLDVEWAHAIAPKAHILLVEAKSANTDDLLTAIDYARRQKGVVAVSMSWGGDESPFETTYDNYLTTPLHHVGGSGMPGGVTFITSSGDQGAPAAWPAVSPNAIAVGGTTLTLDSQNNWQSEVAWAGSGGGFSQYENTAAPDVAYNADPDTGYSVYDSFRSTGWQTIGGTSAGAPQWSALFALVDQGRALKGYGSLDIQKSLLAIYNIPKTDYHDIIHGSNGYQAGPGYDLVTGWGTPIAQKLIPGIINYSIGRNVYAVASAATALPFSTGKPITA